jgi:AraC-like DNA-binding protein
MPETNSAGGAYGAVMREIPATELLDELLSTFSVRSHIAFRGLARERWDIAGAAHGRLAFNVILSGTCWAQLPNIRQPVALREGALLIHRPTVSHVLADSTNSPMARAETAPHVGLLCGYFDGAGTHSPLLNALPSYLLWPEFAALPVSLAPLVRTLVTCAHDTSRCGEQVLARLCEVLLLLILRDPGVLPRERIAPLRARCDPALRRAVEAIHAQPGRPWTLTTLARSAGISRSTFAQRFTAAVGVPAMTYLRRHRLALAEKRMRDGQPLERTARALGYRNVAAFRRARLRDRSESRRE